MEEQELFKKALSGHLSIEPSGIFLFWKGRVALYAILKAIGIKEGDEIILPAFTCVVVVNPIIYLGAHPVYVDIDPMTYNMDISKIEKKITNKTRVILAQNTFGLSPDIDETIRIANKYKLTIIEDCAHGFGGFYKGKPNGTIAEASFFSTQWNKPFSTGLGGIAVTRNGDISKKLREMEEGFLNPSIKDEHILKNLLFIRNKLNTGTYWKAMKTYRWLSKKNLILGSSQGEELDRPVKPDRFEKGFSKVQAKQGTEELKRNREVLIHRKGISDYYKEALSEMGIDVPYEPGYAVHTYLKFPLLVRDRDNFFIKAMESGIEVGDWFLSPIHPIIRSFDYWHYPYGENPVGEKISRHIVNLPTHTGIDKTYRVKIREFIKSNRGDIFDSVKECLES